MRWQKNLKEDKWNGNYCTIFYVRRRTLIIELDEEVP